MARATTAHRAVAADEDEARGEPTTDTDYRDAFAKAALALTEIGARK